MINDKNYKGGKTNMNKIKIGMIGLMLCLMILPMVNAESSYTFKQNSQPQLNIPCYDDNGNLCTNSVTCTISVDNPNGNIVSGASMDYNTAYFNYTLSDTSVLGSYVATMSCTDGSIGGFTTFDFMVTPSGNSGSSNMGFVILVFLLIYGVAFVGFFGKNEWVAILGGMAMIGLGIYTVNSGIVIYQDAITKVLSWTTIGLGAFFALFTGIEVIQDTYN